MLFYCKSSFTISFKVKTKLISFSQKVDVVTMIGNGALFKYGAVAETSYPLF